MIILLSSNRGCQCLRLIGLLKNTRMHNKAISVYMDINDNRFRLDYFLCIRDVSTLKEISQMDGEKNAPERITSS